MSYARLDTSTDPHHHGIVRGTVTPLEPASPARIPITALPEEVDGAPADVSHATRAGTPAAEPTGAGPGVEAGQGAPRLSDRRSHRRRGVGVGGAASVERGESPAISILALLEVGHPRTRCDQFVDRRVGLPLCGPRFDADIRLLARGGAPTRYQSERVRRQDPPAAVVLAAAVPGTPAAACRGLAMTLNQPRRHARCPATSPRRRAI